MKSNYSKSLLIAAIVTAMCGTAFATGHPPKPDPKPAPVPAAVSTSISGAKAGAKSSSRAAAVSNSQATGGKATATGGESSATGGRSSAVQGQVATGGEGGAGGEGGTGVGVGIGAAGDSAASSDNTVGISSDDDVYIPRQVPPVLLPMLIANDCGAGANAGASGSGGAGAAGIVWTTKRCYALRSAINFFAIGEYETGCELLIDVNREAFKRVPKPDCKKVAARLDAEARDARTGSRIASCPDCVTHDELAARDKRMIQAVTGK